MAIYMTAQWQCRPGAESKVEEALKRFVASVKQNEPETRIYTALQKVENKASFMTYFIFENETARSFHSSTEWVKRFTDIIYPENLEPVIFTIDIYQSWLSFSHCPLYIFKGFTGKLLNRLI